MLRTPLWPACPAAHLEAHVLPREIELVVHDDELRRRHLQERRRRLHAVAGQVHVGLGLEEHDRLPGELPLRPEAVPLLAKLRPALRAAERVDHHEADVVPLPLVLAPGIAETDDEEHGPTSSSSSLLGRRGLGGRGSPAAGAAPAAPAAAAPATGAVPGAPGTGSTTSSFSGATMATSVCSGGRRTLTPSGSFSSCVDTCIPISRCVTSVSILTGMRSGRQRTGTVR